MNTLYFDTSALLKGYVNEAGSNWIRTLTDDNEDTIVTSSLTTIEAACAFARRRREGSLSITTERETWEAFLYDSKTRFRRVALTQSTLNLAVELANRRPLRAYDAVQLATAVATNRRLLRRGEKSLIFLSADRRLLAIADEEGLPVDNPTDHEPA